MAKDALRRSAVEFCIFKGKNVHSSLITGGTEE